MSLLQKTSNGCLIVAVSLFVMSILMVGVLSDNTGSASDDAAFDGEVIDGDVEFWVTHYDPAQGGINGRNCGGAMVKVCKDTSSPTHYVGKYGGNNISTGVIAVPQDSKYHSRGKVDIDKIPVPLLHDKRVLQQAKIIIPGYNDSQPTIVGDHFATTITKPNRLDLACSSEQWKKVGEYWSKNKLKLDSASGYNGGTKIMGKVVGEVLR